MSGTIPSLRPLTNSEMGGGDRPSFLRALDDLVGATSKYSMWLMAVATGSINTTAVTRIIGAPTYSGKTHYAASHPSVVDIDVILLELGAPKQITLWQVNKDMHYIVRCINSLIAEVYSVATGAIVLVDSPGCDVGVFIDHSRIMANMLLVKAQRQVDMEGYQFTARQYVTANESVAVTSFDDAVKLMEVVPTVSNPLTHAEAVEGIGQMLKAYILMTEDIIKAGKATQPPVARGEMKRTSKDGMIEMIMAQLSARDEFMKLAEAFVTLFNVNGPMGASLTGASRHHQYITRGSSSSSSSSASVPGEAEPSFDEKVASAIVDPGLSENDPALRAMAAEYEPGQSVTGLGHAYTAKNLDRAKAMFEKDHREAQRTAAFHDGGHTNNKKNKKGVKKTKRGGK